MLLLLLSDGSGRIIQRDERQTGEAPRVSDDQQRRSLALGAL